MSYTTEVKETLCKKNYELCCKKAELYGFLLFSNTFSYDCIKIRTENQFILNRLLDLLSVLGINNYKIIEKNNKKHFWHIETNAEETKKIIHSLGDISLGPPLRIDYSAIENECCSSAFLRGVFLSGGYVFSPDKAYHLEIRTGHQMLADDLMRFCDEIHLNMKSTERRGIRVLYIKNSEHIKDFLVYAGATKFVFDFANAEMEKSIKNNVNRAVNCEQANIEKSVSAAQKQIKAILKLKKNCYIGIPSELREIAELRLLYPEITLTELGEKLEPKLSKSGVAHRMKKLEETAKIKNKKIQKK